MAFGLFHRKDREILERLERQRIESRLQNRHIERLAEEIEDVADRIARDLAVIAVEIRQEGQE